MGFYNSKFLSKLNQNISYDRVEKKDGIIDFDALEELYINVLKSKRHLSKTRTSIVPLKREKMISIALDFFKSIDDEFYEKAKNVLLNVDERTNLEIVNVNNGNKQDMRGHVRTIKGKSEVYVPTQIELSKKTELKDDMCTLKDLYTLVHEIAHLLDLNYNDSLPTKEDILRKDLQEFKYRYTFTRELFAESTAISFETLLMEYLMKKTNYPNMAILQEYIGGSNDLYDMTASLYGRLQLVKILEQKNKIDYEDLSKLAKDNRVDSKYFMLILRTIINDNTSLTYRNRYVFAGAMSPTIVRKYHEDGSNGLKDYLAAVRKDEDERVLDVLGIDMDNDGVNKVIENILKQDMYMLEMGLKNKQSILGSVKEAVKESTTNEEVQEETCKIDSNASKKDITDETLRDQKY